MVERLPFEDPKALLQIKTLLLQMVSLRLRKPFPQVTQTGTCRNKADTPFLALPLCADGLRALPPPPRTRRGKLKMVLFRGSWDLVFTCVVSGLVLARCVLLQETLHVVSEEGRLWHRARHFKSARVPKLPRLGNASLAG